MSHYVAGWHSYKSDICHLKGAKNHSCQRISSWSDCGSFTNWLGLFSEWRTCLGSIAFPHLDEILENFQTAFDNPPTPRLPSFKKLCCFFPREIQKIIAPLYVSSSDNSCGFRSRQNFSTCLRWPWNLIARWFDWLAACKWKDSIHLAVNTAAQLDYHFNRFCKVTICQWICQSQSRDVRFCAWKTRRVLCLPFEWSCFTSSHGSLVLFSFFWVWGRH